MDSTLVWALVGGLGVLFLLNRNRTTQNTQKAVAVGADIFDRIMAGGSRASEKIPAPDVYGCTVASFAANSNIPSTFTGKGEPLAKYKFRQMVHEYLPSEYRNRAYFNCANMEATVFWISYMELFFLESFEALYHPSADWMEKFHEYYWKFAITNMVTTIRQPDIPVFVAKLKDAAFESLGTIGYLRRERREPARVERDVLQAQIPLLNALNRTDEATALLARVEALLYAERTRVIERADALMEQGNYVLAEQVLKPVQSDPRALVRWARILVNGGRLEQYRRVMQELDARQSECDALTLAAFEQLREQTPPL